MLLERRILLRSEHPWLLTAAAEGLRALAHPLQWVHSWVPVLPLRAQWVARVRDMGPYVMGLLSVARLDSALLEGA